MNEQYRDPVSKWRWVSVVLLAGLAGFWIGNAYSNLQRGDLAKLESAMEWIETGYLEPVERSKLVDGAIEGMLRSLDDPHTSYLNQEQAKAMQNSLNASFEGIGATMESVDGRIVVVAPIKGSPAEAAGIKPGDQIIRVGGQSLEGKTLEEAAEMIRGRKGTTAELTILRDGREIELKIVRDTIPVQTVYAEMKEGGIGVIRIATFAETTPDGFAEEVKRLLGEGMKGLVIDLRQNPGGLFTAAERISNMLIPDGKPVVQLRERGREPEVTVSRHRDIGLTGVPIAVVIDGGSASASEILAGALKQSASVPLVGEKTFGKGTAQLNRPFRDGSSMRYTIAEWLLPDGSSIQGSGIAPDVPVALPPYANVPFFSDEKVLKENEFSEDIRAVQVMLAALGHDPGREDGFFDSATAEAVRRYQVAKGLEQTGIVTGETTRSLFGDIRELLAANDTQLLKAIEIVREQLGRQ